MEAYLQVFVNFEQNYWAKLLPMAKFIYNDAKNASTNHTPFELNRDYHPRILYEENIDPRFKSKSVDKLAAKLRNLLIMYKKNLQHAQEL